ncbi:hypothetical protein LTR66_011503 [Elasticomyces elasticus]|nr:hypothetical protein LTR66_011503 [Elasticomyces elasticus]KAK4985544.1 hypothetical protein LTR50_005880 [Elasticomyces elasticus]
MSDDFPTPRAIETFVAASPSSDASSEISSIWSKRSSRSDYDELYDLTDDESVEVPLKCSDSVKKRAESRRSRYPSLVIPSPAAWPTIQKLQKSGICAMGLSPATNLPISPRVLSLLSARNLQIPTTSATPSLAGSFDSEELALSSCPSTPDVQVRGEQSNEWGSPVQLHPDAIATLHHILPEEDAGDEAEAAIELAPEAVYEMCQIDRESTTRYSSGLLSTSIGQDGHDPLSALSIPSPGGFFSSLDPSARHTWCISDPIPSTSTAEQFYGVPWQTRPENPIRQTVKYDASITEGPQTACRVLSPTEVTEVVEINDGFEYSEDYQNELKQTASASFDRTELWLHTQSTYLAAICETAVVDHFKNVAGAVPASPDIISPSTSISSPSKKSVRFADVVLEDPQTLKKGTEAKIPAANDETFFQGFRYILKSARNNDAFHHRQVRVEAIQVERCSVAQKHRNQLLGRYEISDPIRPSPARPISTFLLATEEDSDQKELIARAEKERQALEQIRPSAWGLEATKMLQSGKLLTSPAAQQLVSCKQARILDIGGQASCDWAWAVATMYRKASICTVTTDTGVQQTGLQGPDNHQVVKVQNYWTFEFPDNHFDIVSARSLHALLKTSSPKGDGKDEFELCLAECMRVLKPNGCLEFNLLDAELVHPGTQGSALSVEFAFNLRTRGYDPTASKNFLPRLRNAGFEEIKRAWIVLPMADVTPKWTDKGKVSPGSTAVIPVKKTVDGSSEVVTDDAPLTGSTAAASGLTGLVGARMWEQWMLKLQLEMGKPEERVLEGVGKCLEEGGKGGAGWRGLVGFFKTLVDREVRVELKNNITIRGTLKSVDQYLNIKLDDVTTVNEIKYPHLVRRRELEGLLRWDGWSLEVRMGLADGVDEMWDKQEEDA